MAKKITVKGLVVITKNSRENGSTVQLASEVKLIAGAAPGTPNATAKTVFSINHVDPDWADQFKPGQKIDVDLNIS